MLRSTLVSYWPTQQNPLELRSSALTGVVSPSGGRPTAGPFAVHWSRERPFVPAVAALAGAALLFTMALRYWAVSSLGDRWNTRVLVEPGVPAVSGGPYRFLRHPNYLAVVVEVAALPMLHTAWLTAIVFTVLDAWMLRVRIAVEERALLEHGAVAPAGAATR